jgi:ribosome recycling factor
MEANLGISPQSDGTVLRLNLPSMTEDRRKEMVKHVKTLGEEGKVAVRNIRRDVVEKVKKAEKAKEISEDGSKNLQTDIQKLTDKYTKQIEEVTTAKEKEVLTV